MGHVLTITPQPIRVTSTGLQPLFLAMDVSQYDILDVRLWVLAIEGGSPSITLRLYSSATMETDDGFLDIGGFGPTSGGLSLITITSNVSNYLRWNVTALSGTEATFFIRGIGRVYPGGI